MLEPLNKITKALHDTLFTRAEGTALSRLTARYGMLRPLVIRPSNWRAACRSSVFAAKGTPGPIFKFLEHALGEWIDECSTFEALAISPNTLEITDAADWMCNRFVRIGDTLYRSANRSGNSLYFITAQTTLFTPAAFTTLQNYTAKFLPFDIKEINCAYEVLLDDGILEFPPTYLRENAEARGDEPLGGHLMEFGSSTESERFGDPLGDGPFPAYLGTDDFTTAFGEAFINMLVAGVRGRIIDFKWVNGAASVYGSIFNRTVYGTTLPEAPDLVTPTRG